MLIENGNGRESAVYARGHLVLYLPNGSLVVAEFALISVEDLLNRTFAHTMGEFGVVLMVGGNICGETRTISIAMLERAQAFDDSAVALMSLLLPAFAFVTVTVVYTLEN